VPFGLPSLLVGAVTSWPGGVWVATNRTPQADAALTFVGEQLTEFRTFRGLPATGVPFTRILDLTGLEKTVYAATDYGLAYIDPADGRYELIDDRRGLPDSRVYSVVARQGRIVVGTARGLARMDDSLRMQRVAPRFSDAAYAVFPAGDSIWVGTPRGVMLALPGEEDLVRPAALASASLQGQVIALGSLADTVVALTRDGFIWRNPRGGAWTLGPNLSALLGRLRAFAGDGPGFWVAGDRGVGFARLGAPALLSLHEGDLPGDATDLTVSPEHLWVATTGGLVRFRLDAIRP
jgi:ligand-binding sensor domain-containing protein